MSDTEAELIAQQVKHAIDLMRKDLAALSKDLAHESELSRHRLKELEKKSDDFEARIRAATEGVTQFKYFAGLASGGSGFMSIVALIKAFFGG